MQTFNAEVRCAPKQRRLPSVHRFRSVVLAILCCIVPSEAVAEDTFAALAARAEAARDSNRLDEAIGLYRRALVLQPAWKDGWWSLGTIFYDRNEYAEAIPAFRRLVAIDPKNGTGYAMLGLCEFETEEDSSALLDIQTGLRFGLLTDEGLRKVVLYHEGVLLLRQGRFGSAQEALLVLAGYGVRDDQLALALGMAVLSIAPQNLATGSKERAIVLWAGRAETLGAQKEPAKGEKIYASLAAQAAEFPNLHYAFGRYLLLVHKPDEAVAEFQQEIKNNPSNARSYLCIAAARYRLDSAEGVKYAEDALRLDPVSHFGHYILGLLYADTHEYAKAIPELEQASKQMSTRPDIFYALGNAYARIGREQDAAWARETFHRLSAEIDNKNESNVYGDNSPVQIDAATALGEKQAADHEDEKPHP